MVHAVTLDSGLQLGKVNNSLGTCIPPCSFPLVAIKEYKRFGYMAVLRMRS